MSIKQIQGCLAETLVVVLDEARQEPIGRGNRADPSQPPLLDEAVLQGEVCTLHAPLRCGSIGADHVDVEVCHRSAKLSDSRTAVVGLAVDAKHRRLVAVEGDRTAMALQVAPDAGPVLERGFRLAEAQLHELTRGVVDEDEQYAARPPVLEPLVVAAIDLDQLSEQLDLSLRARQRRVESARIVHGWSLREVEVLEPCGVFLEGGVVHQHVEPAELLDRPLDDDALARLEQARRIGHDLGKLAGEAGWKLEREWISPTPAFAVVLLRS